ncbi:hypothetical protein ABMA27_005931 [Loxostege sticticalis]|uniref:Uncharacterized protein n=1 Tax=Loxostege sticticalis TaxID=481309 RepID=A0ABR3HGZ6_LOXSC
MKFLFAFAFVALATAVPMPVQEAPEPISLPQPDVPEVVEESHFMPLSIEPMFIAPEVAAEFYKSLEDNPPLGDVEEIQPEPINFVDVAENDPEAEPFNYANSEIVAEEIQPEPVNFVDDAVSDIEEIQPSPINFVDEAVNDPEAVPFNYENSEIPDEPRMAIDFPADGEIQPEPVNFVDDAVNDIEEIQPSPLNIVEFAVNDPEAEPFNYKNSEIPEPIYLDTPLDFDAEADVAAMLR